MAKKEKGSLVPTEKYKSKTEKTVSFPFVKNGKLIVQEFDYLFCERCEIWICCDKPHTQKDCDFFFKGLAIRKAAEKQIIN